MTKVQFTKPIRVDHVARIEGKAAIDVVVSDGKVDTVNVNIIEGPRFFEAITIGKKINEATAVFPRICSFCASAHKVTALQAAENAMNVEVSEQTLKLRELMYLGDYIESHALHLFLLAIPDYLGYPSAFAMADKHKDAVVAALKLKDIGAKIQAVLGSRYIHQESAILGGFGKLPTKPVLKGIADELRGLKNELELAANILGNYDNWPELDFDRVHLGLHPYDDRYSMLGDVVYDSNGKHFPARDYKTHIKEKVVPHSFAKHSFYNNEAFMTGAISRYLLFGKGLEGRSKDFADKYSKLLVPNNPMANNMAQAVELIYFADKSIEIADNYATNIINEEPVKYDFNNLQEGVSITEAPRGMVAYTLTLNKEGLVETADVITPTAFFMPLMEQDVRRKAEHLIAQGESDPKKIGDLLETVVRSYDPCVSCSVHVTGVKK